ncbi:MAG: fibrobacter succinogenes major paralogous domain-containing protein [Fibrobacter sp.]|nr:fibrobacter succinogenes major paralogous domain-containing protein [Fibrobacter sp.]
MKKFLTVLGLVAFLAACGDDSSSTGANGGEAQKETSSSSFEKSNDDAISSSNKEKSSSSARQTPEEHEGPERNQNNPVASSSSIVETTSPCEGCFDWSIPKEAYLNPEIEYDSITDERDGKVYKTVKIGEQVWMAENLNYSDSVKTPSLLGKNLCYDNDEKKCEVAGRLYTWAAAIDSVALSAKGLDCGLHKVCELPEKVQGICPQGWHLPSSEEWVSLHSEIGGNSYSGSYLKSQRWDGDEVNTNFDRFGFSAIPAGEFRKTRMFGDKERDNSGEFFGDEEREAFFWLASEDTDRFAYFVYLFQEARSLLTSGDKDNAHSIRCVKDN